MDRFRLVTNESPLEFAEMPRLGLFLSWHARAHFCRGRASSGPSQRTSQNAGSIILFAAHTHLRLSDRVMGKLTRLPQETRIIIAPHCFQTAVKLWRAHRAFWQLRPNNAYSDSCLRGRFTTRFHGRVRFMSACPQGFWTIRSSLVA